MNGKNIIEEIQALTKESRLDNNEANRLILAGMKDILVNQLEFQDEYQRMLEEVKVNSISRHDLVIERLDAFKESITKRMDADRKFLESHWGVKLEGFVRDNPKLSLSFLGVTFVASNLWLNDVIRYWVVEKLLAWIIPESLLKLLIGA